MRNGSGMLILLLVVMIAVSLAGGAVLIGGPGQRAEADAVRIQAETRAAEQRAMIREMQRDAAHERTTETLPYLVAIVCGGVVLVLLIVVFADLRATRHAGAADPALLVYLQRLRLDQAERDRDLWRAIARLNHGSALDRRSLSVGDDRREVVEYSHKRQ